MFSLSLDERRYREYDCLRVLGKNACWASGYVVRTGHWVIFGDEHSAQLHQMSDLKPVYQFPAAIVSLHSISVMNKDSLLVGFKDRWTVLSVPELREEMTVFHSGVNGEIIMNREWIVEIRAASAGVAIGKPLSLSVSGWRWSTLSANHGTRLPEPDVLRICEIHKLSDTCRISFPQGSSDITFDNEDEIAVVHLSMDGVDYRMDPKYYSTPNQSLFSGYGNIGSTPATNLNRDPWQVTADGSVQFRYSENGISSGLPTSPTTSFFFGSMQSFNRTSGTVETVRTSRGISPSPIHVWYSIFAPLCFWCCYAAWTSIIVERTKLSAKHPYFWLGIFSAICYFAIITWLEPHFLNFGGFWKYPVIAWSIPPCFILAVLAYQGNVCRENLRRIGRTSLLMYVGILAASYSSRFIAIPALSHIAKSMFAIALLLVYFRPDITNSPSLLLPKSHSSRIWRTASNWMLNITIGLQVLLGIVLLSFWAIYMTSESGNMGSGIILLITSQLARCIAFAATIAWLVAWLHQSWRNDFIATKTIATFLITIPCVASFHLF